MILQLGAIILIMVEKQPKNGVHTYVDTTVYEIGVYGFVQQTLFEKLTLNAGIRLQDHKVYGKDWIPAGGFAFKVTPTTTWKASVGKGFRSPTIQELFMWNKNPELKPSNIMNYETGILQDIVRPQAQFRAYRIYC